MVSAILNSDVAALEQILAPSFVYTASELGRRSRHEWLRAIPTYRLDVFEIHDMSIEPLGDIAIVHAVYAGEFLAAALPAGGTGDDAAGFA